MRALLAAVRAVFERRVAEIRFGTDLMRTVLTDDVLSQLRAVTGSQEASERVVELALEMAKNDIRAADVEPLLRARHQAELLDRFDLRTVDVLAAYRARAAAERRRAGGRW